MAVPDWLPAAIFLFAAGLSAVWFNVLIPLDPANSRWVISAVLGAVFAALAAPNPWIAAFTLWMALSIPWSLIALDRGAISTAGFPPAGAASALLIAAWVAGLGLTVRSLQLTHGTVWFLVGLVGAATYNNAVAALEVFRGLPWVIARDPEAQTSWVARTPDAYLHNPWKPAGINAVMLPVALGLTLQRHDLWPLTIPAMVAMVWQIDAQQGATCLAAAFTGCMAFLIAGQMYLPAALGAPLGLVAWPRIRRKIMDDPRWEAWAILWATGRKSHWLGMGLGAWQGLAPETPKERGKRWYSAHNDWLETLLDCGPVPIVIAVGYLMLASWTAAHGLSPLRAGVFGGLVSLAVLSAGYMPWRTWPVSLFALGTVTAWEALGRG